MKFPLLIPASRRLSGTSLFTTVLLATVLVVLGGSSAPVLAVTPASELPVSPPPEQPDLEAERQVENDSVGESMESLITEPATIDPAVLAGLPAVPELLGTAGTLLQLLRKDLQDAEQAKQWAEGEIVLRTATVAAAEAGHRRSVTELGEARVHRGDAERDLTILGIDAFVNQSDQADVGALLIAANSESGSAASDALRTHELYRSAGAALAAELQDRQRDEWRQEQILEDAVARRDRETESLTTAQQTHATAIEDIGRLGPQAADAERSFERQLLLRRVPGSDDLTVVAVNAYVFAERSAAAQWPACGISWHQLAGVGRVESFHGQFGRSSIDDKGNTSPPILGPQLNGDPWLAIADSDLGLLDGDLEWDRAVGPMQFIPTSWELFAADGNGDGRSDPHNLYDAALAAADHLCGTGLESESGFRRALLGYNRSTAYGSDVIRFSDLYRALVLVDTDPVPDDSVPEPVG